MVTTTSGETVGFPLESVLAAPTYTKLGDEFNGDHDDRHDDNDHDNNHDEDGDAEIMMIVVVVLVVQYRSKVT